MKKSKDSANTGAFIGVVGIIVMFLILPLCSCSSYKPYVNESIQEFYVGRIQICTPYMRHGLCKGRSTFVVTDSSMFMIEGHHELTISSEAYVVRRHPEPGRGRPLYVVVNGKQYKLK